MAQALLAKGANFDATMMEFKPLHLAAYYDRKNMVKMFIEHGADVNALAFRETTPLHIASQYGEANYYCFYDFKDLTISKMRRFSETKNCFCFRQYSIIFHR